MTRWKIWGRSYHRKCNAVATLVDVEGRYRTETQGFVRRFDFCVYYADHPEQDFDNKVKIAHIALPNMCTILITN